MSLMYPLIRKFFFTIDAEKAHLLGMNLLKLADTLRLSRTLKLSRLIFAQPVSAPRQVMGLTFPNAVGLAAGLDKNGDYIEALSAVGFGFIEIGTVTPRPQPGNPQPRLFRIPEAQAIVNRMGFNNKGVEYLAAQVRKVNINGILGINIGKNFDTPVEQAADDYIKCLQIVYPLADYVTINISSPNTPGLRNLQFGDELKQLLTELKTEQLRLQNVFHKYVPLAVKIAPDMDDSDIQKVSALLMENKIDAVIATNTTVSRDAVAGLPHAEEQGGLSGVPLREQSTHVVEKLAEYLHGNIPIIAAGGIFSAEDAQMKISAGADLVQIYTGFIYKGSQLIKECADALK